MPLSNLVLYLPVNSFCNVVSPILINFAAVCAPSWIQWTTNIPYVRSKECRIFGDEAVEVVVILMASL